MKTIFSTLIISLLITACGENKIESADKSVKIDSTNREKKAVTELNYSNSSIVITPSTKTLKFGVDNVISIVIPNEEYPICSVENATICPNGGDDINKYRIKPKFVDKPVILRVSAKKNDTIINYEPIEFEIKN